MRSALVRELSWGSVARATDGERGSVVCAVPSSGNCHGEAWLVASSRNCHGDADCGHKKTPSTEADGVMRLKVGGANAHAEHGQQQYG